MKNLFVLTVLILLVLILSDNFLFAQETDQKDLPTREQIEKQLLHKTKTEVLKILGKPNSSNRGEFYTIGGGEAYKEIWIYDCKNKDEATGKRDLMHVFFNDAGIVSYIRFSTSPKDLLLGVDGPPQFDELLKGKVK